MSKVIKIHGMKVEFSMKFKYIILFLFIFNIVCFGQTFENQTYKIEFLYGDILKHTPRVVPLIQGPVTGAEVAVEFQTMGERAWHQYLNYPVVGLGVTWLNLGNPTKLGQAFAFYPYVNIPLWKNKFLNFSIKAGAGLSFVTKNYYNTNTDSLGNLLPGLIGTNAAIGSVVNVYLAGGASLTFPLGHGFSLAAEYNWNHISNGNIATPNAGLNFLNSMVGIRYCPNENKQFERKHTLFADLPRKFSTELTFYGGMRSLYYLDHQFFPVGAVAFSISRPLLNYYQMGLGIDAFYDGVYGAIYISRNNPLNTTKYGFTYITEDQLINKIRIGVSWQHELIFGRLTAGFHVGVYLFNPIKNLEPFDQASTTRLNKPLIYPYNIEEESGWFYSLAILKYSISRHFLVSVGLKTHLQKAEFIEWGVGYKF